MSIIQKDAFVLIKMPSSNAKIVHIQENLQCSLGKFGSFRSDRLVGLQYHQTYEIVPEGLKAVASYDILSAFDTQAEDDANNQTIFDDVDTQKLSNDEIHKMKMDALEGNVHSDSVIQTLIENNASFAKKTQFSKAKFIKRKQSKYNKMFVPLPLSAKSLCEFYFATNPSKIRDIRIDTLSQILTLSNVHSGSKVLIADDTNGLLTAAVAERLGGIGRIFVLNEVQNPNLNCLRTSNMPQEHKDVVVNMPWFQLASNYEITAGRESKEPEVAAKMALRMQKRQEEFAEFKTGNFDALIIASKYDPTAVLAKLVPFLGLSGQLVVYDSRKEVLLEAYNNVRFAKSFVATQLTESWLREYQVPVFSAGTHPTMSTSGSGGYLFSAIHVLDVPNEHYQTQMRGKKKVKAVDTRSISKTIPSNPEVASHDNDIESGDLDMNDAQEQEDS